ncbi:hypothetical protein HK098_003508 [Nowakowskiella sp. JEL0407]|nr:hypothetical protein HK098_003508 [Nowakowskiella sp. JEL0407]
MIQKLTPILLDLNLNSRKTVYLNIYQNFLMTAIKMLMMFDTVKFLRSGNGFVFEIIEKLIDIAFRIIKRKDKTKSLSFLIIKWLGYRGFHQMFEKCTQFAQVANSLAKEMELKQYRRISGIKEISLALKRQEEDAELWDKFVTEL